jgi:hypothetical protein
VGVIRDGETVVLRRRLDRDRSFVVAEVARIQAELGVPVLIARKAGMDALKTEFETAGVDITWVPSEDYPNACAAIFDAVAAKEVEHGDYPELNDAVRAATKRKVGQRFEWDRHHGDISMLEAMTLAHWSVVNGTGSLIYT